MHVCVCVCMPDALCVSVLLQYVWGLYTTVIVMCLC